MSPPSQAPGQPVTAAHIDAWIHTATLKRLQLHLTGGGTLQQRPRAILLGDGGAVQERH
jgi:hypothetical protein